MNLLSMLIDGYLDVHFIPSCFSEDDPNREPMPADLGIQFTEMFIKDTENPSMLLLLLEV